VTAMRLLVQGGTGIDAIVLAGGGVGFFAQAICRAYPKHIVTPLPGRAPLSARSRSSLARRSRSYAARSMSGSCVSSGRAGTLSMIPLPVVKRARIAIVATNVTSFLICSSSRGETCSNRCYFRRSPGVISERMRSLIALDACYARPLARAAHCAGCRARKGSRPVFSGARAIERRDGCVQGVAPSGIFRGSGPPSPSQPRGGDAPNPHGLLQVLPRGVLL
jgi:hypothetical protein